MTEDNQKFEYTYNAPTERERKEAERIREYYSTEKKQIGKMERLIALDKKAKTPSVIAALSFGIIGTLIFGTGLTMILELGVIVGGVIVGGLGLLPMFAAYPVYRFFSARGKRKYGDEILRLSEEILKDTTEE